MSAVLLDRNNKMPFAALKVKIMPESPEIDLQVIEDKAKVIIEELGGKFHSKEIELIAFGLKALIILIAWPEEQEFDTLEQKLSQIESVNSAQVVDFRRAVG